MGDVCELQIALGWFRFEESQGVVIILGEVSSKVIDRYIYSYVCMCRDHLDWAFWFDRVVASL